MRYGELPKDLGQFQAECKELMFYQYLPIKMAHSNLVDYEDRLQCFSKLIEVITCNFIQKFGYGAYDANYIYITAKYGYQMPGCSFNRMGYHSDGFMTDDINYIWCDKNPTIFNHSRFELTMNDLLSLREMENQALSRNEFSFPEHTLIRLNQFNIHKVAEVKEGGMRTFLKVSFSQDKYDLIGNSHNYLLDYQWDMKPRGTNRNIPQSHLKIN